MPKKVRPLGDDWLLKSVLYRLTDIAHATINRKDIHSLLNHAVLPHSWIPVSDSNSVSLNDMVPLNPQFSLSYIT
jgi:hypothetical protein